MGPFRPLLSLNIEPKTTADRESLVHGLQSLMTEDPMFRVQADWQTGRATIFGMGERQLAIIADRVTREFNVEATVGRPTAAAITVT
jgi:elongation factor G